MRIGSPTFVIFGIVHLRLKTWLKTILNVFWTLIACDDELKMSGAFIALANFLACLVMSACSDLSSSQNRSYLVPTRNAKAFFVEKWIEDTFPGGRRGGKRRVSVVVVVVWVAGGTLYPEFG